jgi:phage replication O-like protein O
VLSLADVQLENGYTKIANEILERLALTKLSPTQFRLILVIWRYTYGYNRKDHAMSLSFLSEATGVHKQRVKQELDELIEKNIIIVTEEGTFSKPRKLAFNKDYDTWRLQSTKESTVSKTAYTTVSRNADTTVSESAYSTVSETAYSTVSNSAYQEIKNINKNINKNLNKNNDYYDDDNKDQPEENVPNAFRFFEENFYPMPSSVDIETINYWLDRFPEEIVIHAMKKSLKQNARNIAYVEKILINWERNKVKSLEDIERLDRQHELEKMRKRNYYFEGGYRKPVRTEAIPEWLKNINYETPQDDKEEDQDIEKKRQELAERLKKYKDEYNDQSVYA